MPKLPACPTCHNRLTHLGNGVYVCNIVSCKNQGRAMRKSEGYIVQITQDIPIFHKDKIVYLPRDWQIKSPDKPIEPCSCDNTEFWFNGNWNCAICHPQGEFNGEIFTVEYSNRTYEEIQESIKEFIEKATARSIP